MFEGKLVRPKHIYRLFIFLLLSVNIDLLQAEENSQSEISAGVLMLAASDGTTVNAPTVKTEVEMDISGLTARVKVVQFFENNSPDWVEGVYYFPLPEKSAVDSLAMMIGERVIEGEIKEKQVAKKLYQKAKISGVKASLVEQLRPNIFSNKVANIAPFESVKITIEYQQELAYLRQSGFAISFPMAITPRFTPEVIVNEHFQQLDNGFKSAPSSLNKIDLAYKKDDEDNQIGNDVQIQVNLNAGMLLEGILSSSHKLQQTQLSDTRYAIRLAGNNKADRDFHLNWKPVANTEPRAALFSQFYEGEQYISLMLMPPVFTEKVNYDSSAEVLSREVIFVLDTSGSMAGESIVQAKRALLSALDTLSIGDKFNIIEFNNDTHQLFSKARLNSPQNKREARQYIQSLNADGGTQMLPAMKAALNKTSDNNMIRQVIFLTDGAISNEAQLFHEIEKKLADSRLFTVGIGSAPNEFFMKRAAQYGRGKAIFISDVTQSQEKMEVLFEQISRPLLSHIKVNWPDNLEVEMWPQKIPDLFDGQPLWIKAKLKSDQQIIDYNDSKNLKVEGRLANQQWQSDLSFAQGSQQKGIAKLWAREKIASIMNHSYHGQLKPEQRQAITQTALKHHLVSRFTSLVAIDKTPVRVAEKLYQKQVQQKRPKGSAKANLNYPKTAIDFTLGLWWSILLLTGGLVMLMINPVFSFLLRERQR